MIIGLSVHKRTLGELRQGRAILNWPWSILVGCKLSGGVRVGPEGGGCQVSTEMRPKRGMRDQRDQHLTCFYFYAASIYSMEFVNNGKVESVQIA